MPMFIVKATTTREEGLTRSSRTEGFYVCAASANAAEQLILRHYALSLGSGESASVHTVEPCAPTDVPSTEPVVLAGGGA